MVEQQPAPDAFWFATWVIVNSPWITAGVLSAGVRFVYMFGNQAEPFRKSFSDALICFAIVSVSAPVAEGFGLGTKWAMPVAVGIGLLGAEAVRGDVINRIKNIISGGKK